MVKVKGKCALVTTPIRVCVKEVRLSWHGPAQVLQVVELALENDVSFQVLELGQSSSEDALAPTRGGHTHRNRPKARRFGANLRPQNHRWFRRFASAGNRGARNKSYIFFRFFYLKAACLIRVQVL